MAEMRPAAEMKDSGIEWVGQIPSNWRVVKNNRLFRITKTLVDDAWETTQLLSLTKGGIIEKNINDGGGKQPESFSTYQFVEKDDIVLCLFDIDVSAVFSDRSSFDGMISPAYRVMKCEKNILPVYAKWWFDAVNVGRYYLIYTKSLRKTIDSEGFGNILTAIPPLSEQQAIADYLDDRCSRIDEIITEATASIEKYKELKQAVITEAVTGRNTQQVFSDSKNAVLGAIPSHWKKKRIKDVSVRITVGVVVTPANYFDDNGTIPFLRGINVKEYVINDTPMVYISEETNRVLSKTIVHTNDLVIVRDGAIGVTAVVPEKFDGANVVSMIIVTPDSNTDPNYLCYVMNSEVGKVQFELTKIGAALTHTSVKAVSNIDIPFPPIEEQKSIVAYLNVKISQMNSLISEKQALIDDLQAYKKSLIYEVVTGKRRVV